MGWSSGGDIFDDAVDVALRYAPKLNGEVPKIIRMAIVRDLYNSQSFKHSDWDTQDESKYADEVFEVMVENGERDPRCEVCGSKYVYDGECEDCYYRERHK